MASDVRVSLEDALLLAPIVLAWSLRGENHPDAGASSYNLSIKEKKTSEGRPGAPAFDPPMPKLVS